MLNHYKWQRAIFLYDEWQQASFSKQNPLPFYVKDQVSTCQTCHMPRGSLHVARITAPRTGSSPRIAGWAPTRCCTSTTATTSSWTKTIAFLQKGQNIGVLNVDLFAIERNGGKLIAPLGS